MNDIFFYVGEDAYAILYTIYKDDSTEYCYSKSATIVFAKCEKLTKKLVGEINPITDERYEAEINIANDDVNMVQIINSLQHMIRRNAHLSVSPHGALEIIEDNLSS